VLRESRLSKRELINARTVFDQHLFSPGQSQQRFIQPKREETRAMSDTPTNESRRGAVKTILAGLAAVPLVNLVGMAAAQASDLPHVDEATDPTAIALKYKHDATQADRAAANRPGLPPEEQICANCQFVQGEGDWVGCTLFPGKAVAAQGWCMSWAPKPAA
jgi:hypothetical protein